MKLRVTKRFYILMLAALGLYVGIAGIGQLKEYGKIREQQAAIQEQIEDAELKKAELEYTIEHANDPEYIESLVRDRLGWVKKGETFYDFE